MTADAFRKLALQFEGATEGAHQRHADFRISNKIFATLPNDSRGVVKLTPEQQLIHVAAEPCVFTPCAGAWGRRGWTYIELGIAKVTHVRRALSQATKNV
ncbi:MAG: MmcQ/YjbR family DNA-binding protein [Fimbriimonadaceae bacterium]